MTTCPDCGAAWAMRTNTMSTLVGYYSEPPHNHDDNCQTREYRCANGHSYRLSVTRRCPAPDCRWTGRKACFCHHVPKIDAWPEDGQIVVHPRGFLPPLEESA